MERSISIKKGKRGQAWSLDVVIATVIFTLGIVILYVYAINQLSKPDESLDNAFYEGNLAAELILSDNDFGILTDGKVNQTKLDAFNSSYDSRKASLGIIRDFYFVIDGMEINGNPAQYVGIKPASPDNLVQVNRITIYKNKIVKFRIYVWQ